MKSPLFCAIILFFVCNSCKDEKSPVLDQQIVSKYIDTTVQRLDHYAPIKLPIAETVTIWNPSSIALGPEQRIFVANLTGEVYSLIDSDNDGLEDQNHLFCNVTKDGYRSPTSIVFREWDLYIGLPSEIRIYRDLDHDFVADTSFTFFNQIPYSDHPYDYSSALTFDSDGWLHFVLTGDSWNAASSPDPLKYRSSLLAVSPDGKQVKQVATGFRSVHGMAINSSGDIFLVDNQGYQNKFEELHHVREGKFYGYDTGKFGDLEAELPLLQLTSEIAPAGLAWDANSEAQRLFVSFYGAADYWSRGALARIDLQKNGNSYVANEVTLLKNLPKCSGLLLHPSGDIYVASVGKTDYWYDALEQADGAIYRIRKAEWLDKSVIDETTEALDTNSLAVGEHFFHARACASCHDIKGTSVLLGPSLKGAKHLFTREQLLEEIVNPSARIKRGEHGAIIKTVDDESFLGKVTFSDEDEIEMMLLGNIIKRIERNKVASIEEYEKSLMYEGLLGGMTEGEIDALLDYIHTL